MVLVVGGGRISCKSRPEQSVHFWIERCLSASLEETQQFAFFTRQIHRNFEDNFVSAFICNGCI